MRPLAIFGIPITAKMAAACRELLAGVATAQAWEELAPLAAAADRCGAPPGPCPVRGTRGAG